MTKKPDEQYSEEETKHRFEAALRGAREVGHESMKDIQPKRSTLRAATNKRKAKVSAKAIRLGKGPGPKKESR